MYHNSYSARREISIANRKITELNSFIRQLKEAHKDEIRQADLLVKQKITEITKEVKQASQTGILVTRNITDLGSVHLRASEDKKFVDLEEVLNILDSNFSV